MSSDFFSPKLDPDRLKIEIQVVPGVYVLHDRTLDGSGMSVKK